MPEQWYYARGQQRLGPVSKEQLKGLATAGQIQPGDLVWRVGMPQWAAASSVEGLMAAEATEAVAPLEAAPVSVSAPAPVAPASAATPIGYYSGPGRLPPRASATLAGHASPAGDVYEWPLDDMRIAQFEQTVKMRKRV